MSIKSYQQNQGKSQDFNEFTSTQEKALFYVKLERLAIELKKTIERILSDNTVGIERITQQELVDLNQTLQKIMEEARERTLDELTQYGNTSISLLEYVETLEAIVLKQKTMLATTENNPQEETPPPKEAKVKLPKVDPSKTIAYRQDGFDFKGFFRK